MNFTRMPDYAMHRLIKIEWQDRDSLFFAASGLL